MSPAKRAERRRAADLRRDCEVLANAWRKAATELTDWADSGEYPATKNMLRDKAATLIRCAGEINEVLRAFAPLREIQTGSAA